MKNLKGSLILLAAAFFWGTTFVAQVSGSDHIGVFTYNASRCFVGSLFLVVFSMIKDKHTARKTVYFGQMAMAWGYIMWNRIVSCNVNTAGRHRTISG